MNPFVFAHATHPQWRMAAGLVIAQLHAQEASLEQTSKPSLGLVYFTDHYANEAQDLLAHLKQALPNVVSWAGTVGVGIAGTGVEYFDEPALAVMLCDLSEQSYRVFSGVAPLSHGSYFKAHAALVHADAQTPELAELLAELSQRTATGYLFGGLAASRQAVPQIAFHRGDARSGVFSGALSGVAFSDEVNLISRVTQGCQPIKLSNGRAAPAHRVTKCDRHVVLELDGEPALDILLDELGVSLSEPGQAVQRLRQTLAGLSSSLDQESAIARSQGRFGSETKVRHLVGLDPLRRGIAIADSVAVGMELRFCERNAEAARRDLMRICAEIREELAPAEPAFAIEAIALGADSFRAEERNATKQIRGAIYVSCAGRGGPHFGGESAELKIVRHALGEVPLIGFFAGGEIARCDVYGYTGVLTVITD